MASRIRKGDSVVVLTGKDKGRVGEVLEMHPSKRAAVVRGVRVVKRHLKPTREREGGIVDKELPIDLSNISLIDPKDGKPTRVGFRVEDGKKVRYSRRGGDVLPAVKSS